MKTGIVATLVAGKGYGFIQQHGRADLRFERTDVAEGVVFEELRGKTVSFVERVRETAKHNETHHAANVKLVEE